MLGFKIWLSSSIKLSFNFNLTEEIFMYKEYVLQK